MAVAGIVVVAVEVFAVVVAEDWWQRVRQYCLHVMGPVSMRRTFVLTAQSA